MKLCPPHWDELKAALDQRGLGRFTGRDIARVVTDAVERLPTASPRDSYDPLMSAMLGLYVEAIDVAGGQMLHDDAESELCPVCYVVAGCQCGRGAACLFLKWVEQAADAEMVRARKLGLLPRVAQA